jgi:cob(I)alamin adenosyltransferase
MKITKVYTKRGDTGMTDLVGGVRISKSDIRLEAYGTIDELSAHIGLLVAMLPGTAAADRELLQRIQSNLFNIGTHLATDQSRTPLYPSAQLPEGQADILEKEIDSINASLPEPQGFVLPGGCLAAAQAHVCRTVCRRAERCIDTLAETAQVGPEILKYVNRLSDYLFVFAKKINFNNDVHEILWQNACK